MRVDALAVRLRPRPMGEAADLGVLLVHGHARSILRVWGPLYLVVALLALATIELGSWVPGTVIFCLKPWLDRSLLFVLSRAVFGEATHWRDLRAQRSAVWWRDLLASLTLRRLSPWRSYTQPIAQLEGQRGKARRSRRNQLLRGKRGAASAMHIVFANAEMVLCLGLVSLAVWFAPEGTHRHVFDWLRDSESVANQLVLNAIYVTVVFLLEPFYVAAGFAMYLNRRVELEAWDIEQEFRRAFA
jgi:thiosulfate reductase cytochrome b subunit